MRIAVRGGDRWALTGRYVEVVWSEFLGPTATLLARRLGNFVELHPRGGELSLTVMGRSLGVAPSTVRKALRRLAWHGITMVCDERAVLGVSGLAPLIGPDLLARLSADGGREHQWQLQAAAGVSTPASPARDSRSGHAAAGCPTRGGGSGRSL